MRVIVFGAGRICKRILSYPLQDDVEILFLCDNDESRWGQKIAGYPIKSPAEINNVEYDLVIVACLKYAWVDEMRDQLSLMGVPDEKIMLSTGIHGIEYFSEDLDRVLKVEKKGAELFKDAPVATDSIYRGETYKSYHRRQREGFFGKYCQGQGLDIGYGGDLVAPNCVGWDMQDGDAQYMQGVKDESFDYVYSSHCLEHMADVRVALRNWFRLVKKGGYLIIAVPHRDLYEKKKRLPSRWNSDHKHMFLIGISESPDTLDIVEEIRESIIDYDIKYIKACDEGHTITDPFIQSDGEYQIEVVLQKKVDCRNS